MKFYEGKFITNFYHDKMPKKVSHYICLSVVLIGSVFEIVKTIILQCFQKNANIISKKKVTRHITEDVETSSDDSDESDEE